MALASAVHKLSDIANRICCVLCVAMLIGMVALTSAQIICRVFFSALSWSEEATRYLLVWSTFIGGSIVYKNSGHISVTLIRDLFPKFTQKPFKLVVQLVCGAFCAVAIYFGLRYMKMQGTQLSAALRIPMRFMYMAIPAGFAIMELHVIDAVISLFVGEEASA